MDFSPLLQWFGKAKRPLPWRSDPSPYQVWVSEVMLQQTQAATVIPYYQRFLKRFATLTDLAKAPIDEVLKLWEGLGYYSRARNLHAGAQYVLEHFNGQLPQTPEELKKIKGIGPYTLGAIMSFAYRRPYPAVDGNVLRVWTRLFAIEEDIGRAGTRKRIEDRVSPYLNEDTGYLISEALIELGALVCRKEPLCHSCPMAGSCLAKRYQMTTALPIKEKKIKYEALTHHLWVFLDNNRVLVRREKKKLMMDLYQFPHYKIEEEKAFFEGMEKPSSFKKLPTFKQSFTRFRVSLEPFFCSLSEKYLSHLEEIGYEWVSVEKLQALPFSSGHRRLLNYLYQKGFLSLDSLGSYQLS